MTRFERYRDSLRSNKGSTIITVLVAVALVAMLGALLLFTTYTGFLMKVTERGSTGNFYDAETAVNEIRVGVQLAVSDAIASANTVVLEHYNAVAADVSTNSFKTSFISALFKTDYLLKNANPPASSLPISDYYNAQLLKTKFIQVPEQSYVTIVTGVEGDIWGSVIAAADGSAVTLKNLTLKYTKNGYETYVTTDIVITVPDFTYTLTDLVTTAIQDYVIVADTALEQTSGGALTIDGNVYAGQANLSGSGNELTIGADTSRPYQFITKGAFSLANLFQLNVGAETSLWAKSIELGAGSGAVFSGETYVADDLELNGDAAQATLSGRYYGFGSSTTAATESSAIVINGRDTDLAITPGLKTLMLAGNSFIGVSEVSAVVNTDIITGESVSAKSNQLAYLIPPDCINTVTTNPVIYTTGTVPDAPTLRSYINTTTPLWAGGGSLAAYSADVQLAYLPITASNQTLVYFYMKFDTAENASTYFIDYFHENSDKIEKYLKLYSDTLSIANTVNSMISGNAVYFDALGDVALNGGQSVSGFTSAAALLQVRYQNLCKTLSPNNAGAPTSTVYTNIVNESAVAGLLAAEDTKYFTDIDSKVAGMITKSASVKLSDILTAHADIKVIVSDGNVVVDRNFSGLIIAKGTVTLQNSVDLDRSGVSLALQAKYNTGTAGAPAYKSMLDYLLIGSGTSDEVDNNTVTWDLKTLVGYSGWSKY